MDQNLQKIKEKLTTVHVQCSAHVAYANGCLDTLEKMLQLFNEVAEDTDKLGISLINAMIARMRAEVTAGKQRFVQQVATLEAMKKLLKNDVFKKIVRGAENKSTDRSSLILPAYYRR